MTTQRADALSRIEGHYDSGAFMTDLARRVAIPTESAEAARGPEMDRYMRDEIAPVLERMGCDVTIHDNPDPRGWPFLVAKRIENRARPTLLTYGHGDVVRGIPEHWSDGLDPWTLRQDGERFYGRGTADNKGQHSIVIAALETVLATRGRHGFNTTLLLDMGEEIGSPGLEAFVAENTDLLAADVLIASDGPRMTVERADIKLGNRGVLSFDLAVNLRQGSRHSGHWGGVLEDPGIILAHALASITTPRGQILVKDWLPKTLSDRVREMIAGCRVDPGADFPRIAEDWGEPGLSREEKMYGWTSFIILAFITGRPENPVNGVQPTANARCQLRFTKDVDPDRFLPALREHLDSHGFSQVEIIRPATDMFFPASRTDPDSPWIDWAVTSIAATTGARPITVPNSAGGLPGELFAENLGVPTLWVPHSYTGCKQHGPDEHVLGPLMREGLRIMTGLFWDLGEDRAPGR